MKMLEEKILDDKNPNLVRGYIYSEEKPSQKTLIYVIDRDKKEVIFYPRNSKYYFSDKVVIKGFDFLPEIFKPNGFTKNKVLDRLNRIFKDKLFESITISKSGVPKIITRNKIHHLYLPYLFLVEISDLIGSTKYHDTRKLGQIVYNKFSNQFSSIIKPLKKSSIKLDDLKQAISTISAYSSESFDKSDISAMTEVMAGLMHTAFKSQIANSKIFKDTKLKLDTVTLDEVVEQFEKLLRDSKTTESEWGQFLEQNLFLIDSKYIHSIPELNVVLGGTRRVDFGLVDSQGYMDLFEIKRPQTTLLTEKRARGNHVWDKQAIEAIVQAEKYLLHAERKSRDLCADIKREKNVSLEIIRPRTFVLMGDSSQLNTDAKKEDFRMLKHQFKNIEIVTYDELLQRIKNQRKVVEKK